MKVKIKYNVKFLLLAFESTNLENTRKLGQSNFQVTQCQLLTKSQNFLVMSTIPALLNNKELIYFSLQIIKKTTRKFCQQTIKVLGIKS